MALAAYKGVGSGVAEYLKGIIVIGCGDGLELTGVVSRVKGPLEVSSEGGGGVVPIECDSVRKGGSEGVGQSIRISDMKGLTNRVD